MKAAARPELLVIDDDRNFRETLAELLETNGYAVRRAASAEEGRALLHQVPTALTLCDWRMPGSGGEQFLLSAAADGLLEAMPVLIMTAYGSGPSALQAMQLGAYDFIPKPLEMEKVLSTVQRALRHVQLQREVDALRAHRFADSAIGAPTPRTPGRGPVRLVGSSPAWIEVFKNIGKVARTDLGVLVLGESGTGKEMVARAIHDHSDRARKPFIIVNCAAIPAELLESELFGHERGAFTSAIAQKTGKFEAAQGGTLFLDEIGELPLALQPKLLRVLQEHTFERLGSTQPIRADVRVVAATNRQLGREVEARLFRADLFYRLNTYTLQLPPLRSRASDIVPLAEYFLEQYALRHNVVRQGLTEDACQMLQQYSFPGNVRELEHLMDWAAVQAAGRAVTADLLKEHLASTEPATSITEQNLLSQPFHAAVASLEKALLENALRQSAYNKSEAARLLGIHRRLLYEKLQQHGLA